jgi:hypothetical protein
VLKDVLLYPNSVSVPLMTNFGVPPEPQGMVKVTLAKIDGLKTTDLLTKGDPYVVFEVRASRNQQNQAVLWKSTCFLDVVVPSYATCCSPVPSVTATHSLSLTCGVLVY